MTPFEPQSPRVEQLDVPMAPPADQKPSSASDAPDTNAPPPAEDVQQAAMQPSVAPELVAAKVAPSPAPKPTVGRIVHYHVYPVRDGKLQPYAATITHVFGDNCVNLSIVNDISYPLDPTQVFSPIVNRASVDYGEQPGCWSWPPRT